MAAPTRLRTEHHYSSLGLTASQQRLSWWLPDGAGHQLAYQLRVGDWDSGRVISDQSLLVPYTGPPLISGQRVTWAVKVWTDTGESDWAKPAWWEMGLLRPSHWVARWVQPPGADAEQVVASRPAAVPEPVWLFRGQGRLTAAPALARLYVTAHGIYEFFVNGRRVGDIELTPGFTSYRSILQYQTFDVTDVLRAGDNVFGAIVSGGWLKSSALYREQPLGLLAQLHVRNADGSLTRLASGADWLAARGAVRTADLRKGQVVDLRDDLVDAFSAKPDPTRWSPVDVADHDLDRLVASPAPPVRRVQEIRPASVTRLGPDRQIVDLGQNINGWVRLNRLGPRHTVLLLTHGEALGSDGDVTVEHIAPGDTPQAVPFQQDQVTSAGRAGDVFEPRHTTHGFRYVRIEGHPDDLTPDDVAGIVVHTDLERTGWFKCSDDRINRLHEAAVWSLRGNVCDIPTDCPTRERAGWTGDWQIFVPTAAFLYDVAGFSAKWLTDLAADQRADGVVLHCAPNSEHTQFHPPGSAGWGDAAVIVPWEIYRSYGDRDLLERQWPSMTAWVDYAARQARLHRHPSRARGRHTPAAHEQFLWDTGFHWGEWLEPGMLPPDADDDAIDAYTQALRTADHGPVATAYLHLSARLLANIAHVLGRGDDALTYWQLATAVRAAWQAEFLRPDGTVSPESQPDYTRALAFDLIPGQLRRAAVERLVELIRKADTHLATGFLATPHLLPVLADNGYLDVAYELLFQDTEPSWLTMIDRGATTVWEHWSGIGEDGLPSAPRGVGSLNHYSKGAVISFLHRYVGGIQQLGDVPGYRSFRIAPMPGGGITWACASYESPYGLIESSWRIHDDEFVLDATVPPGTRAEISLPDGQLLTMTPGKARYRCMSPRHLRT